MHSKKEKIILELPAAGETQPVCRNMMTISGDPSFVLVRFLPVPPRMRPSLSTQPRVVSLRTSGSYIDTRSIGWQACFTCSVALHCHCPTCGGMDEYRVFAMPSHTLQHGLWFSEPALPEHPNWEISMLVQSFLPLLVCRHPEACSVCAEPHRWGCYVASDAA